MSGRFGTTNDLLLELGEHIKSQALFSALCLVSKRFNAIFTPKLLVQSLGDVDNPSYFLKAPSDSEEDDDPSLSESPLAVLAALDKLEDLTIVETNPSPYYPDMFDWRSPPFQNLCRFDMRNLTRDPIDGDADDIAEVLLACPNLRFLGLSIAGAEGCSNWLLRKVINHYDEQRIKRRLPLLRLTTLELGLGFLPEIPDATFPDDDYLVKLTDLSFLETLSLTTYPIVHFDEIPYAVIDHTLFASATKVQHIHVDRLSRDVIELINFLKVKTGGRLTGLSAPEYSGQYPVDEAEFPRENLQPWEHPCLLKETGYQWVRLSCSTETSSDLAVDFLSRCVRLEELCVPMPRCNWSKFKEMILPRLQRLQALILAGGELADLNSSVRDRPSQWSIYSEEQEQKWLKAVETRARDEEEQRRELVLEVFRENRAWVAEDGGQRVPLLYFGIGSHVYQCVRLPYSSSGDGEAESKAEEVRVGDSQGYTVLKLSPEEACRFDSVARLHELK
ncbi:hypothetical protein MBLNU459_g1496t1 [Dothideomycetes sp. NU459]